MIPEKNGFTVSVYHYQKNQNWASSYLFLSGNGWMTYNPPDGQAPTKVTVNVGAMPDGTVSGSVFNDSQKLDSAQTREAI